MSRPSDPHPSTDAHAASVERRAALFDGMRQVMPAMLPTAIWGLVTGVAMVKSGLTETMALTMTVLVFAGSAQLTSLPLIATGAPLWLIFAAGLVVNLRFVIFAAALQPFFRHLSWPRRLGLGYFTTDITFIVFMPRFGEAPVPGTREHVWFYAGTIIPGWIIWQLCSLTGIVLGSMVPSSWSLEFAAVLALLALAIPLVNSRPVAAAALAAGLLGWAGQWLPLRLGLVLAVVGGVLAGILAERRLERTP